MDEKKIFDVPAPSEAQQLIDFETHFADHQKNEHFWQNFALKKQTDEIGKLFDQIKHSQKLAQDCQVFRSKLKEVYNFTQMIGPVGLAKYQPYWTPTPKIWAIEAGNVSVDSVDDFIQKYPPFDYDLYFYDIYPSKNGDSKYTVRFAIIEKSHKNSARNNEAASVAYSDIQEYKGNITPEDIEKQFGF